MNTTISERGGDSQQARQTKDSASNHSQVLIYIKEHLSAAKLKQLLVWVHELDGVVSVTVIPGRIRLILVEYDTNRFDTAAILDAFCQQYPEVRIAGY